MHDGRRREAGLSLVEALVSTTVVLLALGSLAGMLLHSSRLNRSQQLAMAVQSNARNCLALIVERLRSAGWDPQNAGLPTVMLDPLGTAASPADGVDNVEVYADLNADSETDGVATDDDEEEQVLIRHVGDTVEWRLGPTTAFVVLARGVTNDADGDGLAEPMFVPDDALAPERITVRITARSPVPDPQSGQFIRYTVTSDVALRSSL
jgi:hypothetical protein